jgi:hypothetical protein
MVALAVTGSVGISGRLSVVPRGKTRGVPRHSGSPLVTLSALLSFLPLRLVTVSPQDLSRLIQLSLCPRFRLLAPLPRTSRQSLQLLWRRTKRRRRKTSRRIRWPLSSDPAILPVRFSPCFEPKSRPMTKLKVPTKSGQSGSIPL